MRTIEKTKEQILRENIQLKAKIEELEKSETEAQDVKNRLKESELKSRIWLENSPVCTKIVDLDFNLQYMSASGVRGLKIDDISEYYGKPYPLHFYPDSFKIPMSNNLRKVKESGKIITQEAPIVDVEGKEIWYHSTLVPVNDDKGDLDYIMVVSLETTLRKQAEDQLSESKERYDLALKATQDGIFDWDLISNEIYYSPVWKSMLGYKDDELPNDFSVWEKLTDPEHVKRSWEVQNEVLNGKRDRFEMELKMKHKDGHWVDIHSRSEPVFDKSGKAIRMVGTHVDITKQKKMEAELRKSEETNRTLLNNLNSGVVVHAPDTSVIFANPKACELLGLSVEQMTGKKVIDPQWKFLKDDYSDMLLEDYPVNRVLSSNESLRNLVVGVNRPQSGDVVWVLVNGYSVYSDSGNIEQVIINFIDITERKLVEEELTEHRIHLEELVKIRTSELETKNAELSRFNELFVNREFRIKELRDKVSELEKGK